MNTPVADAKAVNELLARYGVKFGIYKNGTFNEQLFPFDAIPRIISAEDFSDMEKGLIQRVDALNLFLKDIYSDGKIIRDGIIPEDFVYISKGYLAPCAGITPPKGIYSHISGIDLVQAQDGTWYILEDNLRIPSGASYPLIARELCRMASPGAFENNRIADNRNYAFLLRSTMDNVNCGGINVILTPGRYNAAYFEHSYLAEKTGAVLVQNSDLAVAEGDKTVMRKADLRAFVLSGEKTQVWASGLTRFSRKADSFVVNSSQGGGFKDTWVLLPE